MPQAREKYIDQERQLEVIKLELDRGFHDVHQILVSRVNARNLSLTRGDIYKAQ